MKKLEIVFIVALLSCLGIVSLSAETLGEGESVISSVVVEIDQTNSDFSISFDVSFDSSSAMVKSGFIVFDCNDSAKQYKVYKTHTVSSYKEHIKMSESGLDYNKNKSYVVIPFIETDDGKLVESEKINIDPLSSYTSIENETIDVYGSGAEISFDIVQGIKNKTDACGYILFDENNRFLGSTYKSFKETSINVMFDTSERFGPLKEGTYYIKAYSTLGNELVSYGDTHKISIDRSVSSEKNRNNVSYSTESYDAYYDLSKISGSCLLNDESISRYLPNFSIEEAWRHPYNPYDYGQCTWLVYGLLFQALEHAPGTYGNGGNWVNNAEMPGWYRSNTPVVGSIASALPTDDHPYGTVAIVIKIIDENTMLIVHGNCNANLIEDLWEEAKTDWCIQEVNINHYTYRDGNQSRFIFLNPSEPKYK